jgi:rhomboid protease GluP
MALSLVAKRRKKIPTGICEANHFQVIAYRVVQSLGWRIAAISDHELVAYARVSLRSAGEEIRLKLLKGSIKVTSECVGIQPFAFGKNVSNIRRFGQRLKELETTTSKEDIPTYLQEIDAQEEISNQLSSTVTHSKNQISDIFSIFFGEKDFYFTSKILALNVFIYILLWVTGSYEQAYQLEAFYYFGGVHRGLINDGEWWRLIAQTFVHGSFLHLFFNMYAFLYVSLLLEPLIGRYRYLGLYLLVGALASLSSVFYFENVIAIGASGAIFGLYGATLALLIAGLLRNRIRISLFISLTVFTSYSLISGMEEGVDYAAHLGGFASGIVLGFLMAWWMKRKERNHRIFALSLALAGMLAYGFFVFQHISKHPSVFTYPEPLALEIMLMDYQHTSEQDFTLEEANIFEAGFSEFAAKYNTARGLIKMQESKVSDLILRHEAAIQRLHEALKVLKRIKQHYRSYEQFDLLQSAARSCDANLRLLLVYSKALENPNHSYGRIIRPVLNESLMYHNQLSKRTHLINSHLFGQDFY